MGNFDQQTFLEEHIPYRLGNLDTCFHALRILNSDPQTHTVTLQFDTGHEMRGGVQSVTNAWVECGIITCRTIHDFLTGGMKKKYPDDVTLDRFCKPDGNSLPLVNRRQILGCRPASVSQEFAEASLEFALRAASKAVAHLTAGDFSVDQPVAAYQTACLTLKSTVLVHLYDALGISRPASIIRDIRRSDNPPL